MFDWKSAFDALEVKAREFSDSVDEQLYYYGEIDDPYEMLRYFAPLSLVDSVGKANWLVSNSGRFITVDDCAVDCLMDSGKLSRYPLAWQNSIEELYRSLNKENMVKFRMEKQGLSYDMAHELVCEDLGIPAYANEYKFNVVTTICNSLSNELRIWNDIETIEADDLESAKQKLLESIRKEGDVVCSGTSYVGVDTKKLSVSDMMFGRGGKNYVETVIKIEVNYLNCCACR